MIFCEMDAGLIEYDTVTKKATQNRAKAKSAAGQPPQSTNTKSGEGSVLLRFCELWGTTRNQLLEAPRFF